MLAGMRPGPRLFTEQAPQALSIMLLFVMANLFMIVLAVVSMRFVLRVLTIPPKAWPPAIIVLGTFGAYIVETRMFGAHAALLIGLLSFLMLLRGFPLPPALLGFILGPILEANFVRLMIVSRGDPVSYILGRPVAIILLIVAVGAVAMDIYQRRMMRRAKAFRHGMATTNGVAQADSDGRTDPKL